jgi:molecular chaperone GrpE
MANDEQNDQTPEIIQEAEKIVAESTEQEMNQAENDASPGSPEPHADAENLLESLKRERADFMNYKARTQREIETARDFGVKFVARQLLPVLDEIGRAKDAGDLDENSPFGNIAAKLEDVVNKLNVSKFGAKGDIFDPSLYEALTNRDALEGENLQEGEIIVDQVVEPGYKYGDEILRVAKVITVSA